MTIKDKGSSYISDFNSNQCVSDEYLGPQQQIYQDRPVEYVLTSCDCEENEGKRTADESLVNS